VCLAQEPAAFKAFLPDGLIFEPVGGTQLKSNGRRRPAPRENRDCGRQVGENGRKAVLRRWTLEGGCDRMDDRLLEAQKSVVARVAL
jgi:hypothetical protein